MATMTTIYEASISVPYTTGFWMPHTEWTYKAARCSNLAECMHWLYMHPMAKEEGAQLSVDIRINGRVEVTWEFTDDSVTIHVPR